MIKIYLLSCYLGKCKLKQCGDNILTELSSRLDSYNGAYS